jgi:tripartite-type tricarboxylate transporter receptor subunit TctC
MHTLRYAAIVLALTTTLHAAPSPSQAWPQRTVRIILPLPASGGTDLAARLFAERLAERWRQPVIVENVPGADGILGVTRFIGSRDDHTLLFSFAGPITINPLIHDSLPYDPVRDLVPIVSAIDNFFVIAASSSVDVDSIQGFVARARKEPGKLNWTATAGLPQYLFTALQKRAGVEMTYVPYREFTQALQDLSENRVHAVATSVPILLPLVQRGRSGFSWSPAANALRWPRTCRPRQRQAILNSFSTAWSASTDLATSRRNSRSALLPTSGQSRPTAHWWRA